VLSRFGFKGKSVGRRAKGKDFSGKAEEKISRAEDFFSLFFLPPGMAEDFLGLAREKISQKNLPLG